MHAISTIRIPPVKGTLKLVNGTVGNDGYHIGNASAFEYSAKKGSAAAVTGFDKFVYDVEDVYGHLTSGQVFIRVQSWDDLLNTPPIAYGTTFLDCDVSGVNGSTPSNSNASNVSPTLYSYCSCGE